MKTITRILSAAVLLWPISVASAENTARLESSRLTLDVDRKTGSWTLLDRRSGARWPAIGRASVGQASGLDADFAVANGTASKVDLRHANGVGVTFELVDDGSAIVLRYSGEALGDIRALDDVLVVTDRGHGHVIVPCREGLLIGAGSGKTFRRTFGTSDYEGCHMNLLGFIEAGSALLVTWDDAYVFPEVAGGVDPKTGRHEVRTAFSLRGPTARSLRIQPLGKGDWNAIAAAYRVVAERKKLAVTLREKTRRNPHVERMVGASNVKLWTCLARRMNEPSTREESVTVRWTFDEAASIAEHLRRDIGIDRCLFMIGGWTEGGYDCRHPDNLPANPECGGNAALADAIDRIQKLGYVASLHDNYQDMYRDARSWDESYIAKSRDGKLRRGGRWLGGRAYIICPPKGLELARRPQNLPGIRKLFPAQSYFIDTTYAAGPQECSAPDHAIGRNEDIVWKKRLSDYARDVFGLFGSECGREWALPHSDFFEGLVAVSGRHFHNLDPTALGAMTIPFWEMVYHDCQIAWGKYGYSYERAADYVAHHVLCARPLHYHSIPNHLYWKTKDASRVDATPRVVSVEPAGDRAFRIRYEWTVGEGAQKDWRIFVHFGTSKDILFQDDHAPPIPTSRWKARTTVAVGPHTVRVPRSLRKDAVDVMIGLFDPRDVSGRAVLPGGDGQRRVVVGRLKLAPRIEFEPAARRRSDDAGCWMRTDEGWADGLHPVDVFVKNTHEVLGPLHAATAHGVLTRLEFLTSDRSVRRATWGAGDAKTVVTVNFGAQDATVESRYGGRVVLPRWGFVIDGPRFAAFLARRWGGQEYADGALFTLRALGERDLDQSRRLRVFHAFGTPKIRWRDSTLDVQREKIVEPRP